MNRAQKGLALLPRHKLRPTIHRDIQHWLDNGHRITQLPPGNAIGLSRYERINDRLVETGLRCEY